MLLPSGFSILMTYVINALARIQDNKSQILTSLPRTYFNSQIPALTHTASPSIAIQVITSGASGPTNSSVIFPPSHNAQLLPRHVRMCILGPSVAPLNDRVCNTNGTWLVISPSALNGTNRRGSFLEVVLAVEDSAACRRRFRGGGVATSESSATVDGGGRDDILVLYVAYSRPDIPVCTT